MEAEVKISGQGAPSFPYVVRGAQISCSFGGQAMKLDSPISHGSMIRGKAMLNEEDCKAMVNIPTFGACKCPANQAKVCQPAVGPKWIGAKADTLVDDKPALIKTCMIICMAFGGIITIKDDGQEV